jgi:hypothetical protein
MSLASGTKLGPYEIESPLGAGGMGEVYRARDTRLDRIVAVKILPSHLSSNLEAKQRFEREARTISSLNHLHICVLPPSPQARIIHYRLSPDGRWLAYTSTESGREEVYVTHFPSGQGKWQVSQNEGTFPVWRGDSKEIWFAGADGSIHAANVNAKSGEFELDPARTLFQISYLGPLGNPYDVAPDGQRLIFNTYPESIPIPLVLVTNWTADAKK